MVPFWLVLWWKEVAGDKIFIFSGIFVLFDVFCCRNYGFQGVFFSWYLDLPSFPYTYWHFRIFLLESTFFILQTSHISHLKNPNLSITSSSSLCLIFSFFFIKSSLLVMEGFLKTFKFLNIFLFYCLLWLLKIFLFVEVALLSYWSFILLSFYFYFIFYSSSNILLTGFDLTYLWFLRNFFRSN